MVTKLKAGTKVGQLGIWNGTEWVAGDPDCNIVKWGGTALTARDITTLLDHLNVDLSTRGRLQPWYQANFLPVNKGYISDLAPAGTTNRWTYTVPANRIAMIMSAYCLILRSSAATTLGGADAIIDINALTTRVLDASLFTNTVGATMQLALGQSAILKAGDVLTGKTYDGSVGGTVSFGMFANIMEFDT